MKIILIGLIAMVAGQVPPVGSPKIVFEGNRRVSSYELLNNFKVCSENAWKSYDERAFGYYRDKCTRQFLWSRGFLRASVREETSRLPDNRFLVKFHIHEGPRYRWGEITFKDLQPKYLGLFQKWFGINRGEIADGILLRNFVFDKLHAEYSKRGYVQFMADFDLNLSDPVHPALDGTANVTVTVDEGRKFKVNRVEFVGVGHIENQKLKDAFPFKRGDIFVPTKLARGIETINRSRKYRLVDRDADVELHVDEESSDVDVIISLKKIKK